jgi:hypothetical protein
MLCACGEQNISIGDLQEVMVLPAVPNRNLDILFVIDTSGSMGDEQQALSASFPRMMDALSTLEGGLPDLHIGVVTTDMGVQNTSSAALPPGLGEGGAGGCVGPGDDGQLRHIPELGTDAYISDVAASDGTRIRNYSGALRDVFASLATVGAIGCGIEQPLAAMRRALTNPANEGFLRPDANLAVIIISDEDDCSVADEQLFVPDATGISGLVFRCTKYGVTCDGGGATPTAMAEAGTKTDCHANATPTLVDDVAPYVDFLQDLKGDPNAVMVAAIVGDPDPLAIEVDTTAGGGPVLSHSCNSYELGVADPAVRIAQLVGAFPNRGVVTSICNGDLELPLTSIGSTAKKLMGDPCLDTALADASAADGLQPLCEVLDGSVAAERPLPACDAARTSDCWRLVPDDALCSASPERLRLEVMRAQEPAARSYAHLRCLTR